MQIARKVRSRWECNIRVDPIKIGVNRRNWIDSAQESGYGIVERLVPEIKEFSCHVGLHECVNRH